MDGGCPRRQLRRWVCARLQECSRKQLQRRQMRTEVATDTQYSRRLRLRGYPGILVGTIMTTGRYGVDEANKAATTTVKPTGTATATGNPTAAPTLMTKNTAAAAMIENP